MDATFGRSESMAVHPDRTELGPPEPTVHGHGRAAIDGTLSRCWGADQIGRVVAKCDIGLERRIRSARSGDLRIGLSCLFTRRDRTSRERNLPSVGAQGSPDGAAPNSHIFTIGGEIGHRARPPARRRLARRCILRGLSCPERCVTDALDGHFSGATDSVLERAGRRELPSIVEVVHAPGRQSADYSTHCDEEDENQYEDSTGFLTRCTNAGS